MKGTSLKFKVFVLGRMPTHICDIMGQNQSHVAIQKRADICTLSEMSKDAHFLFSEKVFKPINKKIKGVIDYKNQLFPFKAGFLIIIVL